jgi:hypothetical protein
LFDERYRQDQVSPEPEKREEVESEVAVDAKVSGEETKITESVL